MALGWSTYLDWLASHKGSLLDILPFTFILLFVFRSHYEP